jgi:hypothetical protein
VAGQAFTDGIHTGLLYAAGAALLAAISVAALLARDLRPRRAARPEAGIEVAGDSVAGEQAALAN